MTNLTGRLWHFPTLPKAARVSSEHVVHTVCTCLIQRQSMQHMSTLFETFLKQTSNEQAMFNDVTLDNHGLFRKEVYRTSYARNLI